MKSINNILFKIFISFSFMVLSISFATGQSYYEVKVVKGDGIFSLLRRFNLNDNPCNYNHFLKLNNLKNNSHLIIGKKYKIPVLIYIYNGKSIRSTIGNENMEKALRIKTYNEYLLKNKLRRKTYIDSKILWVPHHELDCENDKDKVVLTKKTIKRKVSGTTEKIKPEIKKIKVDGHKKGLNRYVPLFGTKYASVPIIDNSLGNRVFYVLSGHGGPDPGAICTKCNPTLCEDEYAYDVSLRLARDLMQHGAIVHIIVQDENDGIRDEKYLKCDKDEVSANGRKIPLSQRKRLKQRSNDVNRLYAFYKKKNYIKSQTLIVTHVDSRHKDKRIDVFFSYAKGSKTGKKLAKNLLNTFDKKYSRYQKGRGYNGSIGERNWYVLNNTLPPAVFIELANIKNPKDHDRILISSNRQALANWIFEALYKTYK